MSSTLNISLKSKGTPTIDLKIGEEAKNIIESSSSSPVITFVATGDKGDKGEQGTPGTASVGNFSITGTQLANNSVTASKIASGAVNTSELANSSVTTNKIANGAITISKLANNSVGIDQIIDGTVTTELLTDGVITADKLGALSIDTTKLQDGIITDVKVASKTITGNKLVDNIVLGGTTHVKRITIDGESPGFINGPSSDTLNLRSTRDLVFTIDYDESTQADNSSFIFKNGAGTSLATLDETGVFTLSGSLNVTGDIVVNGLVDGVDIAQALTVTTNQLSKLNFITITQGVDLDTIETNVATNNAKVGITTQQATDITTNNSKVSFPGFGTTAGTALEGNTTIPTVPTLIDSDTMTGASSTNIASAESIKAYVDAEVSGIVDSAPSTLNTLNELAAALGDDANFSTTVTNNIATKQPILSEGAFANGDKTKLDGIATGATASPDLTVDGAGTIHANNVPTLNQNTTGNAATATALTSGNKIIQGELEVQGNLLFSTTDGDPQHIRDAQDTDVITITDGGLTTLLAAGNLDIGSHDFRAESFTSDAATGQAPFTVSSTTEVANLRAATATNLAASTSTTVQLGTIELGHASDTTIARTSAGTATIEGKEIVTINKMRDVHTVAYHYSGTAGHYLTMSGATTSDSTFLSSASFHLMRVMPYDGKIIRITCFNQSSSSRSESFKLYIDGDDNPLTDNRGSELTFTSNQKGSADCPSDWTFSAGESVAIRRQPSVATQGTNISIVFEFDMTT